MSVPVVSVGRLMALSWALAWTLTDVARAQVGLSSDLSRVTLVARVAPSALIESVAPVRERVRQGAVRDLSVVVKFSANAPHRLVVRRCQAADDRIREIRVRVADGEFRRLDAGAGIVIARDSRGAGESEREVYFRVESTDTLSGSVNAVPVRFEIAVDPTL